MPLSLASLRSLGLAALLSTAAALPALADEITLVLPAAVQTLDPHMTAVVGTDLSLAKHIYSTLTFRNTAGEIEGDLAESWTAIDDLTWEFKLRAGVTFPNGEALDAEAVKWNLERIINPETQSRNRGLYAPVEKIEVIDATTIRLISAKPFPVLPAQLTMLFLLAPKWSGEHNLAVEAMGSGPYEIVTYTAGDRVVLKAREGYYGPKPAYDTVTLRMIAENAVRMAALRAGEVDFVRNITPNDLKVLEGNENVAGGWFPSIRSMVVKMDATKAPFDNLKLREAVTHAIDRQAIMTAFYNGWSEELNCQILTDRYFGYNPDLGKTAYDPEKSMKLIADSGVKNPTAVLEVPVGQYLLGSEIAQIIAAQLEAVGFKIEFKESEYASWVSRYSNGEIAQITFMGHAWPTMDADGMLSLYANKTGYWQNETFLTALEGGRTVVAPEARKAQYKIATEAMCADVPTAPLFSQPTIFGHAKDVVWSPRPDDWTLAVDFAPVK